jgi:CDGSH-type Zn-finger protein
MFKKIKEFFFGTPTPQPVSEAPYKVEPPTAARCGCGRSNSGFCVGLHKLTTEEWAVHLSNPNAVQAVVEVNVEPVAVVEAPAKKPRKPRTPKIMPAVKKEAPEKASNVVILKQPRNPKKA